MYVVNSVKPHPQTFNRISRLIAEVLNDQNLFTESYLADWFSSYVQFCSGGNFSERVKLLGSVEK